MSRSLSKSILRFRYGSLFYANSERWLKYLISPAKSAAVSLYLSRQRKLLSNRPIPSDAITIIYVSDTHGAQPPIPDGDLLIHAGDLSNKGHVKEVQSSLDWLNSLPHQHKVAVAENHDFCLDETKGASRGDGKDLNWGKICYLRDSCATLQFPNLNNRTLTIYGSPWTEERSPKAHNALQYVSGENKIFGKVPLGTDVVVSHGPPIFHRDKSAYGDKMVLKELRRVEPKLCVCGHMHSGHGVELMKWDIYQAMYETLMSRGRDWDGLRSLLFGARGDTELGDKDTSKETLLVNGSMHGQFDGRGRKVDVTNRGTLLVNGSWFDDKDSRGRNIIIAQI